MFLVWFMAVLAFGSAARFAFDPVADGEAMELGPQVLLRGLETPGHSSDLISIFVDARTAASLEEPSAVINGDA